VSCVVIVLTALAPDANAQTAASASPSPSASSAPVSTGTHRAPRTWSDALFLEFAASFVPYANDVPVMFGIGVRVAERHEFWGRIGYMPTGDDAGYGFGVLGYRAAFRPHRLVRPVVGALIARLPATCGHDAAGTPTCAPTTLFIFAATGGVRLEPVPWFGVAATLALGVDSFPYPFGMVEIAATFALPLS